MTVRDLRRMPEREYRQWQKYAAKKGLADRRAEFYMANIALTVARSVGNKELTLIDFLFDDKTEAPKLTAEEGATALGMFGGKPVRKLGKKAK